MAGLAVGSRVKVGWQVGWLPRVPGVSPTSSWQSSRLDCCHHLPRPTCLSETRSEPRPRAHAHCHMPCAICHVSAAPVPNSALPWSSVQLPPPALGRNGHHQARYYSAVPETLPGLPRRGSPGNVCFVAAHTAFAREARQISLTPLSRPWGRSDQSLTSARSHPPASVPQPPTLIVPLSWKSPEESIFQSLQHGTFDTRGT
jgi:hypothetical protein